MSVPKPSFYNPLDQSQIEYVPSDLESINDSEVEPERPTGSQRSFSNAESIGSYSNHSKLYPDASKKSSLHLDELSLRKKISGQISEHSDVYTLSRMSSATTRSSLLQRVRYRIVLKLKPRERTLIRDSWAIILNDDSTNNIAAYSRAKQAKQAKQKATNAMHSPQKTRIGMGHSRQDSSHSKDVAELKIGVRSNAFTSSLFCSQFYANLLSMEPQLEQMFPSTKHQAVAFAGVLTAAINHLENLQLLENFLNGLGKRHARILGIEAPHFELMGVAFLRTLQDRFGVHCTVELEEAWSKLYSYLANSILQFGIDPILHIRPEEDTLELPVPNLVEATPKTVINLKQHTQADQQSLGASISSGEESSRRSQKEVLRKGHGDSPAVSSPAKRSTMYATSAGSGTAATPSPAKKPYRFDIGKKAQQYKRPDVRKSFSKSTISDSNKDCIVM